MSGYHTGSDMRYLIKRGRQFYVAIEIPPSLQATFGNKKRIVRTLGTDNLPSAQERRWAVVAEIKTAIDKLRNGSGDFGQLVAEALKDRARADSGAEDEFDSIRGEWSEYWDSLLQHGSEDYQLDYDTRRNIRSGSNSTNWRVAGRHR
jgi:hypothetical protein